MESGERLPKASALVTHCRDGVAGRRGGERYIPYLVMDRGNSNYFGAPCLPSPLIRTTRENHRSHPTQMNPENQPARFISLNPMLSGRRPIKGREDVHELTFTCPLCRNRVSIDVHLNGPADVGRFVWGLSIGDTAWEGATITPSIGDHHIKRTSEGDKRCPSHFSVTNGEIIP